MREVVTDLAECPGRAPALAATALFTTTVVDVGRWAEPHAIAIATIHPITDHPSRRLTTTTEPVFGIFRAIATIDGVK
jgi:hypothetical protein